MPWLPTGLHLATWAALAEVSKPDASVSSVRGVCVGRLVFGAATPLPSFAAARKRCLAQQDWPLGTGRSSSGRSWVDQQMHKDVLWFGSQPPPSGALSACKTSFNRCFYKAPSGLDAQPAAEVEQLVWFHTPAHIVELPVDEWRACQQHVATEIAAPVFWNGQDTSNIFHLLVSFLSRLWLHLHEHIRQALQPRGSNEEPLLLYVFDLHPARPHMFGDDGSPLVPGNWATEFARHAMPYVHIMHEGMLAAQGPVMLRRVHFNLVNHASWVLPSEDLYPPRISRQGVGAHPVLMAMPRAVKVDLGIVDTEGRGGVLLVRRTPPAGRRLTNTGALADILRDDDIEVAEVDLSLMLFAAQVEAVAHAKVLVGAHGQGLFNLIFLPPGGAVVEIPPCGMPLALVFNVAELFGRAFREILDTSCDEDFMADFVARGCEPCALREVRTAGGRGDVDSAHVGDCARLDSACDVRSAQTITLNNLPRAADIVISAHRS
eukprot:gnl/TRDRNA2_/TRDRNA2_200166_c0_seq1.p1 gnl/TRDRNA2_/TRDRNA2_200166_c0~~gnl/TRDRNA2_/TRDRNA2_200166_c0_seq1.p1  ORF type:complete len:490 (+),score=80.90 gnl/TRDRNA2_/TRDRNA2_200166_c0_seq1:47-1516(+)